MSRCLALPMVALLACAHTRQLDQQVQSLRGMTQQARERGAYRCAPEELALSDAHVQFAAIELAEGDLARAREHLVLAQANARAALRLSADDACAAARSGPPEAQLTPSPLPERARLRGSLSPVQRARSGGSLGPVQRARSGDSLIYVERAGLLDALIHMERARAPEIGAHGPRDGLSYDAGLPSRRRRSSGKHAAI